jgi:tRNA dimethylallyltransferase
LGFAMCDTRSMKELPIIFIVGQTATGKTDVSVELAEFIRAEIVSCDSMLVYKEPHIIVNKPSQEELSKVKQHLINLISVIQEFNVFEFKKSADRILVEREKEANLIFTGGSGLYVKVLLDGIFTDGSSSQEVRRDLLEKKKNEGLGVLYDDLKKADPQAAKNISSTDSRRIIRALEVYRLTGSKMSQKQKEAAGWWGQKDIRIFGLRMRRDSLYERINQRTERMFQKGLVEEVRYLLGFNLSKTANNILGIKEVKAYIEGEYSLDKAKEEMKKNTRRFAKRQMTWFKKDDRIEWIDADGRGSKKIAKVIAEKIDKR